MRGKPAIAIPPAIWPRITPAGAGKTVFRNVHGLAIQDHPRRCGENQSSPNPTHRNIGSPPQVRGKLSAMLLEYRETRITPAGAGKTIGVSIIYSKIWDHPRRCGENNQGVESAIIALGSPPQVRGKLRYNLAKVIQIRITPAGAGKTIARTVRISSP